MRLSHIDRMRAIAVLCMVQVHTAAIIPPRGMSVDDPAAFVAAAFGGMAAPMFVMISGWGIHKSAVRRVAEGRNGGSAWISWLIPRVALLAICQILVNVLLNVERGGRFEWYTPGVLTLLAIAALISPILAKLGVKVRASLMLVMAASPVFLGDAAGLGGFWERVYSVGAYEWVARLLWNGTYPALPWLFFILLGTLIYDLSENRDVRERFVAIGLALTTVTIAVAEAEGTPWALTEGNAILTFFPASPAFLVVSGTLAVLAHRILEGDEGGGGKPWRGDGLSFLEPLGKITLTVYVAHFAVLGVVASAMQGEPELELVPAFTATIGHTLIWIPLAIMHQRHCPKLSLEELLRRVSN
ncbi:MAG: hypothetical protein CMB53_03460 [Euryarchaeota archaeon]|mgnify:FL=1|nr:hypothetical protein [Euryarchaeota archaeon]